MNTQKTADKAMNQVVMNGEAYNCPDTIECTQSGGNGYPRNLYHAAIAGSRTELQEIAGIYGNPLQIFRRRDGWQLWEQYGSADNLERFQDEDETPIGPEVLKIRDDVWTYRLAVRLPDESEEG